jgi:hypothetical protein
MDEQMVGSRQALATPRRGISKSSETHSKCPIVMTSRKVVKTPSMHMVCAHKDALMGYVSHKGTRLE